jgi:HNH endonuclease
MLLGSVGLVKDMYRILDVARLIPENPFLRGLSRLLSADQQAEVDMGNKRRVYKNPSRERVDELLAYNPKTGEFRWKLRRGGLARRGAIAGTINGVGYRIIEIDHTPCLAARLAWLLYVGTWPMCEIDHKNRIRNDDRIENLRATCKLLIAK